MRILHTSDFHLKEYGDDRWKSLERLIELGKKEKADLFIISGDLFDKGIDAENLRSRIRGVFSDTGFRIALIPGNHDKDSYRSDMWFGEDVVIIDDLRTPFECQGVTIWGIPFEPINGEEILRRLRLLRGSLTNSTRNILLYHGELLDAFFSRRDFGDEGDERYMPVKLSYFAGLGLDYVLAGHFHSRINSWKLQDGGYFVYPGSPISITKRETGRRHVNIFEVGRPPHEYPLDTPHYEEVVIELSPFKAENPIETVKDRLSRLHEDAEVLLTVTGFINGKAIGMGEKEVVEQIKKITGKRRGEIRYEFQDIQVVLEDELTRRFIEKLGRAGHRSEKEKEIRDVVIHAISQSRR